MTCLTGILIRLNGELQRTEPERLRVREALVVGVQHVQSLSRQDQVIVAVQRPKRQRAVVSLADTQADPGVYSVFTNT